MSDVTGTETRRRVDWCGSDSKHHSHQYRRPDAEVDIRPTHINGKIVNNNSSNSDIS